MAFSKRQLIDIYRDRAGLYDLTANLYYVLGFREQRYRRDAVAALGLASGDAVIEIGCGTGLNFSLLQERIGPSGRIIGVDVTAEMLVQAEKRVKGKGWINVTLAQSDAAHYQFPNEANGILSTFALTLVPEFNEVIRNGARALAPGGRMAILDFKKPDDKPLWLIRLMAYLTKPFGVTLDLADRRPWESMRRHLTEVNVRELYGGFAYLAVGQAAG